MTPETHKLQPSIIEIDSHKLYTMSPAICQGKHKSSDTVVVTSTLLLEKLIAMKFAIMKALLILWVKTNHSLPLDSLSSIAIAKKKNPLHLLD